MRAAAQGRGGRGGGRRRERGQAGAVRERVIFLNTGVDRAPGFFRLDIYLRPRQCVPRGCKNGKIKEWESWFPGLGTELDMYLQRRFRERRICDGLKRLRARRREQEVGQGHDL